MTVLDKWIPESLLKSFVLDLCRVEFFFGEPVVSNSEFVRLKYLNWGVFEAFIVNMFNFGVKDAHQNVFFHFLV